MHLRDRKYRHQIEGKIFFGFARPRMIEMKIMYFVYFFKLLNCNHYIKINLELLKALFINLFYK